MPKLAKVLSATEVRRLKTGFHAVGGVAGLHLNVKDSGAASWILRTMVGTRRRDIGLGGYPDFGLAEARAAARRIKEEIRTGVDPVAARQAARSALEAADARRVTFDQAAAQFLRRKAHEFQNGKHAAQWRSTLHAYASPIIGRLPVDEIELGHIVKVLEPLWTEKTETASRLRGRIESVLAYATASGFRSGDNPARWRGNLDAVLPKPRKLAKVTHHRALPVDDLPEFMAALHTQQGMGARALEFAILTATRSGEVRGARWDEIDFAGKVWTIPAERMKAGKQHRVPLSAPALALLKALPKLEGNDRVFPAPKGGQLSDMTLSAVCRRMEVDAVPHGFRSTFRDWCAERTNYPREVAEQALAHTISNATEAAYFRSDLFEKRARLMAEWAKFCGQPPTPKADVTPIRQAR